MAGVQNGLVNGQANVLEVVAGFLNHPQAQQCAMLWVVPSKVCVDAVGDLCKQRNLSYMCLRSMVDMYGSNQPSKQEIKQKLIFICTPEKVRLANTSPAAADSQGHVFGRSDMPCKCKCATLPSSGREAPVYRSRHTFKVQVVALAQGHRDKCKRTRAAVNGLRDVCKQVKAANRHVELVYIHVEVALHYWTTGLRDKLGCAPQHPATAPALDDG